MQRAKIFRTYYRIIFVSFSCILLVSVLLAFVQFQNRIRYENEQIRKYFQDNISSLNSILNVVQGNLYTLQSTSNFYLNHQEEVKDHFLMGFLDESQDSLGLYFHTDQVREHYPGEVGNITGIGSLDSALKKERELINLGLLVNPLLKSAYENTPGVVLTYYYIQERFTNLYPFISSKDFHMSPVQASRFAETYEDAMPHKNPNREIAWTAVYWDETGKGLMVSAVIPIYLQEDFKGIFGVDLTLDSLNSIINTAQRVRGSLFLINDKDQLIAHPDLVESSKGDILQAQSAFPEGIYPRLSNWDKYPADAFHHFSGNVIFYEDVPNTPWKLVYVVNRWETYRDLLADMWLSLAFIIFTVTLILIGTGWYTRHYFIKPAEKLIFHIQDEYENRPEVAYEVPVQWKPWFDIISNIFQRNREMIEELQDANVNLEKKVQKRTEEISTQNEELIQNQEEILTQRSYIEEKNRELAHINDELQSKEKVLTTSLNNLQESQEKLEVQHQLLKTRDRRIQNSIRVGLSIQQAILPYPQRMQELLGDYFVIYRPKDIVSGDFYWVNQKDGKRIIAAVDCTGHGVPGAFMSMIANALLDKIIFVQGITEPSKILETLHSEVQFSLKQNENNNTLHGMDVALVVIEGVDSETRKIQFAGAKRPLLYIPSDSDEVSELKGTRRSIGGVHFRDLIFDSQTVHLPIGSLLYLGSDGFVDQNDDQRKRFGDRQLKELISFLSPLPMSQQKEKLDEALNQHMLGTSQRDDVLMIGFQLH